MVSPATEHELVTVPDADALAARAADWVADQARQAIAARGRFSFAVSGGSTPWAMFAELVQRQVDWPSVELYQVDERVAPDGDPDRNLTHLRQALGAAPATVHPMPVTEDDLDAGAAAYGATLPPHLDLVHLGLGPDGHTASLVPDDPALDVVDRPVAVTGIYQGHRRMTLTYPALARARQVVWLVTGAEKRDALRRLLAHDRSIPAGRVEVSRSIVFADESAR